jgi:GNAT superfamily N-acetyltransferase
MARIRTYRDGDAAVFESLNREWIERCFALEEPDRAAFRDPHGEIIAGGGQIFFAVEANRVLGTCAVLRHSEKEFELAKMAVTPPARGRGLGNMLIESAIAFARGQGAVSLMLLSNRRLEAALRLYAKHGFREEPLGDVREYSRVDIRMELRLRPPDPPARETKA